MYWKIYLSSEPYFNLTGENEVIHNLWIKVEYESKSYVSSFQVFTKHRSWVKKSPQAYRRIPQIEKLWMADEWCPNPFRVSRVLQIQFRFCFSSSNQRVKLSRRLYKCHDFEDMLVNFTVIVNSKIGGFVWNSNLDSDRTKWSWVRSATGFTYSQIRRISSNRDPSK